MRSSVEVSSLAPVMVSLSPLNELVAVRLVLRGGLGGGGNILRWLALDLREDSLVPDPGWCCRWMLVVATLLAMLMQLTPLRFLGLRERGFWKR